MSCPECNRPVFSTEIEIVNQHGEKGWRVIDSYQRTYEPCGHSRLTIRAESKANDAD